MEWIFGNIFAMTGSKKRFRCPRSKVADVKADKLPPAAAVTPDLVSSSSSKRHRVCVPDSLVSSQLLQVDLFEPAKPIRPTPEECWYVMTELGKLHPEVMERNRKGQSEAIGTCAMDKTILDGVVGTILSQNTTSANSSRAFANLKAKFSTWEQVEALSDASQLEQVIRSAGLAKTKSERIYAMLKTIKKERGVVSLDYLRDYSDANVKADLSRFKGMGPKTISCVMLFAMRRSEFPVDTHVHRICQQLGWTGRQATSREASYYHLNATVPSEMKRDLHCLLIEHGKQCHRCAARGKPQFPPKDGSKLNCPLVNVKQAASDSKIKSEPQQLE
jgi:endonuclease III